MKKDLLFILNNLNCGGAEKALISLLETIDYTRFNVDLFLFKHEGLFFNKIPQQVNIIKEPSNYSYFDMPIKKALLQSTKKGNLRLMWSRLQAGYIFKTEVNPARCEQKVWKYIQKNLDNLDKEYDVAIGYLEKNPIYFCLDNVKANLKLGFIHNDYDKLGMDPMIDNKYFNKLDKVITVSNECANVLKQRFPQYKEKVEVMYNIVSPSLIQKMSLQKLDDPQDGIKIVSVGRLNKQKGFELAIDACEKLVHQGYQVRWDVVGEGQERSELEKLIKDKKLENIFILHGLKENPYPYVRAADIYVQPSRFEGKSIAIDEAKILQKPIITTNFTTAKDQINHEETGLIVEMNGEAIAKGVQRLIDDKTLKNKLIKNLTQEKLGTEEEILKLYDIINAG
ncbi:glycosyltransferase [Alkalihalobacterium chitinilyticum]|uniref:Glycosyltransferase n=1 Tax=Alkalihalobacterium chitinilyticum TaxID=2980103 RepID=A0ABT5VEB7_9BACI|nr:glycosyltransferase [Alkalihalobacterium chitinilyticum]MDE5413796.1 glycosyltransferase [Alkalihalobacterium chitinilyticum]